MSAALLQVLGASHAVGRTPILKSIDLSVARGEIVGLIGPNGSGKSTLLKSIIGAIPAARATILIDGEPIPRSGSRRARQLAFVEQQAPEIDLLVQDVVALGRTPHQRRFAGPDATDQAMVHDALLRSGSLALRNRRYATLSGGERQRVLIARALAQDAPFLLLDEPTNHLDLAAQAAVLALLDTVAGAGTGILLAIHDLTHAAALCDRVVLLDHGAVHSQGHPRDLLTPELITEVFGVRTRRFSDTSGDAFVITVPAIRRRAAEPSGDPTSAPIARAHLGGNMSTWFPDAQNPPLRGGPVLRWGVMAPGEIAGDFTSTVLANTDQRITAVASRSQERADAFARRHDIARAHGSYEQLAADPDVDIVYVASPHAQHKALALLAIDAGKHVLIEKPMAMSATEAEEIATAAKATGVLAAEAMWTRYLPQFDVLRQVLARGDLGRVLLATADVGWQMPHDPASRFFDADLGGGAALDMGVYGYWFAHFAIGEAHDVTALGSIGSTGVDEQSVVALAGSDERFASVTTSMLVTNSGLGAIHGTDGTAQFLDPFVFPARFAVTAGGHTHQWHDTSELTLRQGLAWQSTAIAAYVAEGRTDSAVHSLGDATAVLRVIDEVRSQLREAVA